MRESALLKSVMLRLGARPDVRLFRNNVGVAVYPDGSRVAYGLCPGSSDLVGWRSVVITPAMIGQTVAVFTAIETKSTGGRATPEQANFVHRVTDAGGIGAVVRALDDLDPLFDPLPGVSR